MLEVRKDRGVLVDDGHFFAMTSLFSPNFPYAEFVDGKWIKPVDSYDSREDEFISWEEFEKRIAGSAMDEKC